MFAVFGVKLLLSLGLNDIPRAAEIGPDARVLGFTFFVSVVAGTLFGLVPALQASKTDMNESLNEGGAKGGGSGGGKVRSALVIFEIALALVLLIGAGLMIKSFVNLLKTNLGFKPEHILTFELSLPVANYREPPKVRSFFDNLIGKLKALPSVQSVGGVTMLPLGGDNRVFSFRIEGQAGVDPASRPTANFRVATPAYFSAMRIGLAQGRMFNDLDSQGSPPVLIINESMARRSFSEEDPLGKRIIVRNEQFSREIVGVIRDIKHFGLDKVSLPEMYVPFGQMPSRYLRLVLRTGSDSRSIIRAVQKQVWEVDRQQPVAKIKTMDQLVADSVSHHRFNMLLLDIFAAFALILASVGIYGVMSYSVTQRTHEIGIRVALGAAPKDILTLIVREGMILTIAGIVAGIVGAVALMRVIRSLLFEVSTMDAAIFVMTPLLFAFIGFVGCFIPARRAARVDPSIALHH